MTRLLPNVCLQPVRSQEQQRLRCQAALLFTTYLFMCCVSTAEGLYNVLRSPQNEHQYSQPVRKEACLQQGPVEEGR